MSIVTGSTTDQTPSTNVQNQKPAAAEQVEDQNLSASEQDENEEESDASSNANESNESEDAEENEGGEDSKANEQLSKGIKKRFAKLTKRSSEATAAAQREKERADYYEKMYREAQAPKKVVAQENTEKETQELAPGEPDPAEFESLPAYLKAHSKWTTDQAKKAEETRNNEAKVMEEFKKLGKTHISRVDEFKKVATDYDEVVDAVEDVILNPDLQMEILNSEVSAKLSYELAKNRELLEKINGLSYPAMVREIARLEVKLQGDSNSVPQPEPKRHTSAKAPISPVGKTAASGPKATVYDAGKIPHSEFVKIRQEEMRRKRAESL